MTTRRGGRLREPQRRAARLLVAGGTLEATANRVGVRPTTVSRWLLDPVFQMFVWELDFESKIDCRDEFARELARALAFLIDAVFHTPTDKTPSYRIGDHLRAAAEGRDELEPPKNGKG